MSTAPQPAIDCSKRRVPMRVRNSPKRVNSNRRHASTRNTTSSFVGRPRSNGRRAPRPSGSLARSERNEEHWCTAELLRIKGELVLLEGTTDAAARAEDHFRQAVDWARRQGALSWELRAATSLTQMWHNQGRSQEARELLSAVSDRFTEGLETVDLRTAKALLGSL